MAEEALVNVYQARDILGVSVRTVYTMMNDGRLQRGKRNTSMITRESLINLLASRKQESVQSNMGKV